MPINKIKFTPYTRTTNCGDEDRKLEACPENMRLLMNKINELIEVINNKNENCSHNRIIEKSEGCLIYNYCIDCGEYVYNKEKTIK